ncbi:MAG: hypothetical protein ABIG67_09845 [Pseudomonadota bacterium]
MRCAFCSEDISIEGGVSRQDICPHCQRDLRCCKQCQFYDPASYNECREVSAERILDKERANFCDYFSLKGSEKGLYSSKVTGAKAALEALFKKGPK